MRHITFLLLFIAVSVYAGSTPPITTAPVTFPGTPNSVTLGSDGNIWLIDRSANKVGRLTADGGYTTFAIPTANAIASGITLGPDGNAWFAEFGPSPNKIARVTPDGVITEFSLPSGKSLGGIAAGPDGNVWYTESQGGQGSAPTYLLGRISTADGSMADFALPTTGRAQGLSRGADGNLWVGWVESSGSKYDVLRVTTTGTATTFPVGSGPLNALGGTMLFGPDLNVWFTFQNNLVRVKTDGTVTMYPVPTANSNLLPAGLAIGPDGNLWFSEFSSGKIGQLVMSSVTDSGQATINESDALGGLPQAMFLIPFAPRTMTKTGALDTPRCPDVTFLVQVQDTTQSPSQVKVYKVAVSATCADVSVKMAVNLFGFPEYAVIVTNAGPDRAVNVVIQAQFFGGPAFVAFKPFKDNATRCSSTQVGSVVTVKCPVGDMESGRVDFFYFTPDTVPPADLRGRFESSAFSTVTPDPNITNNFYTLRVTSPDGKDKQPVNTPPNPGGTVGVIQRGH